LFRPNSLLLYKQRPARLVRVDDRLEIELEGGETARVRPKDVTVLHPGPLNSLAELRPRNGEVHAAWEILAGERTHLAELAELVYGSFTPVTAWLTWQLVVEGAYFSGTPENIQALSAEEVARRKWERDHAEANQRAWQAFLERARKRALIPADREFLRDVENLAYGRVGRSQTLRELGQVETPENAHAQLLEWGVWDETTNPYPARQGITWKQVDLPVPDLPAEDRLDLTHLLAYAIDDEGTDTPDDALSLDGSRMWVHVADVAALVQPGSPMDLEARERGLTLHLPEGTLHLLPRPVTQILGLGLNDISPALSFGIDLDEQGQVTGFEIVPSLVRVTRLSYAQAELLIHNEPFCSLTRLTDAVRERRRANRAVMIDFPEVRLIVEHGKVTLRPLPPLRSRFLVEEAMVLTGEQTARFAGERGIHLPFSQQDALDSNERPGTLSGMFALRRQLKRSRYQVTPGPHSGLGVAAYTQVTSPLRRYLDLAGHQQLRAYLKNQNQLTETDIMERIGSVEAVSGALRQAELLSEKHWTLVYLLQNPGWRGEGILVEKRGLHGTLIIPSLALEVRVQLPRDLPLDSLVPLSVDSVNLPQREAHFRVVKS
jgi:exoribonuclease II